MFKQITCHFSQLYHAKTIFHSFDSGTIIFIKLYQHAGKLFHNYYVSMWTIDRRNRALKLYSSGRQLWVLVLVQFSLFTLTLTMKSCIRCIGSLRGLTSWCDVWKFPTLQGWFQTKNSLKPTMIDIGGEIFTDAAWKQRIRSSAILKNWYETWNIQWCGSGNIASWFRFSKSAAVCTF